MTASGADSAGVNWASERLLLWATEPHEFEAAQVNGEPAAQFPEPLIRECGDVAIVRLDGELDAAGAPALRAHLREVLRREGPRCVVDLSGLAFIDSVSLGVLVRHCQQVRARGGSFAVASPQGAVRTILDATGLATWFAVYDTVGEAVVCGNSAPPAEAAFRPVPGTQTPQRGAAAQGDQRDDCR